MLYATFAEDSKNGKKGEALFTTKVMEVNGLEYRTFGADFYTLDAEPKEFDVCEEQDEQEEEHDHRPHDDLVAKRAPADRLERALAAREALVCTLKRSRGVLKRLTL